MIVQENLKIDNFVVKIKTKKNNKKFIRTEDKIKQFLKEWNTIEDVELYKDLYKLCTQLFFATQNNKLECLNYYIDHERDSVKGEEYTVMYAEIKNTWNLSMKDRYNKHLDLLERVLSNDTTLIYCENSSIQADDGQLSLFR